jgi:hypothetical protein
MTKLDNKQNSNFRWLGSITNSKERSRLRYADAVQVSNQEASDGKLHSINRLDVSSSL